MTLSAQMTICFKNFLGTWSLGPPLSSPMPAGKGVDMSELQAQHCITPEQ